jgi:hypothetical protein
MIHEKKQSSWSPKALKLAKQAKKAMRGREKANSGKDYTALVTEVYREHNPEKLQDLDFVAKTLKRYAGKEDKLMQGLRKRYKATNREL